jgi:beta-lactamase superfamily II metal-dependent hydrolase
MAKRMVKTAKPKRSTKAPTDRGDIPDDRLIAPPHSIVVRMYRQGLGDCFLLAFGGSNGTPADTKYVLIDCGVLNKQENGVERLTAVMENILQATGGMLDVLVATHEHADHLSGFLIKGNPFLTKRLTVQQLWLAWTEKVGDDLADQLRKKHGVAQRTLKRAAEELLKNSFASTGVAKLSDQKAQKLFDLVNFEQTPEDIMSHDELSACLEDPKVKAAIAMDRDAPAGIESGRAITGEAAKLAKRPTIQLVIQILKSLVGEENVRYCRPGESLSIDGITSTKAHVLGPPHVEHLIKKDLPSANKSKKEVYMSANNSNSAFVLSPALRAKQGNSNLPEDQLSSESDARHPFEWAKRIPVTQAKDKRSFNYHAVSFQPSKETKLLMQSTYFHPNSDWRRIDSDWLNAAEQLALNLDSDTNNTSLALAFEQKDGSVFLFPGDAQVGNWLSWRNQQYVDEKGKATVTMQDLFSRTVLYKVGHHGSHNATLKRDSGTNEDPEIKPYGLELMKDFIAMIPVDFATAQKSQWDMPHKPLYEALREKGKNRVLRSDESARPLRPTTEDRDIMPTDTRFKPVPGKKHARWRKSEQLLAKDHPLYFEVEFQDHLVVG